MATACEHVAEVRDDWEPVADPECEACAREGRMDWVSLRRCLSCGRVGCCDSSPGQHATGHHKESSHPMVRTLQPGQDWVWCYVDELTLKRADGGWVEVDLFFEAGLGYMREHLELGGRDAPPARRRRAQRRPGGQDRRAAELALGELTGLTSRPGGRRGRSRR